MALLVGATAPDFTLPGWYNQSPGSFALAAERGHPVVLAFYPGDERLVCTRQMCAYSDSVADLHLFDAVVWGISPSDVDAHQSFAEGRRLKMPLLSDVDRSVARAYGVIGPMGLRRSVFVVDAGGRIAWRRVVALNVTFPSVAEIRAALEDVRAAA
jgi:thioredoxin-dependent peroxiredoxin